MNDRPTSRSRTSGAAPRSAPARGSRPPQRRSVPPRGASSGPARRTTSAASGTRASASRRPPQSGSPDIGRWLPVGAAAALLIGVVAIGVLGGGGGESAAGETTTTGGTFPGATGQVPVQTNAPTTPTTAPIVKVPLERNIGKGMAGEDIKRIQQRLKDLGFDPGPVDGIYGTMTIQSVWAFQKLVMGVPSGDVSNQMTPEMWDRMQDPLESVFAPRRPQAPGVDHVEVYLPEQSMIVYHDDAPVLITHISSGQLDANGEPAEYCETVTYDTDENGNPLPEPEERPICGRSKTPGGIFDVDRFVPGTRNGPLGSMWNPIYFNYGIAIHGALNVPKEPASHGCIRIPMHISEYAQDLIHVGDDVFVWNGKKEPEQQTREDELPVWDWTDNTRTTTTTSTTTTTTTVAPTTTRPPTTTQAPTTTAATTPPTSAPAEQFETATAG